MVAYADIEDLQDKLVKVEDNERILARMQKALDSATDDLIHELGFDFFRHPDTEDETWVVRGRAGRIIHAHEGIVSVSLIRIRPSLFTDWIELDATAWDLEAWAASDIYQASATVDPFDHVVLNGTGTYSFWPRGDRLIEITGVRGWPAVPSFAVEANVDLARQRMAADRTFPGGVQSPDEAGRPMLPSRLPDSVYRLKRWSLERFSCAT